MSARPYRFSRAARTPLTWGAFAIMTCLTAYAIHAPVVWWQTATWGVVALVTAFHLLRTPVTRFRLDANGLTTRQGRSPARHIPKDDIIGFEHYEDPEGPGLLNVVLQDGRRETLTLLQLPRREALERAANNHGLIYSGY